MDKIHLSFEERAADLVSQMTVSEKISQLQQYGRAVPRLNIPAYNYTYEAQHGITAIMMWPGTENFERPENFWHCIEATAFPAALGMASMWDPELMEKIGSAVADEGRGGNAISGRSLYTLGSTINLARDPRWGRNDDCYGEDPYLTAVMSGGYVKGMQGDDEKYYKMAMCLKHYAANNVETTRHISSSDMDTKTLREYYTYAWKYIVEKFGVESVMSAYNRVNGIPASAHTHLLDTLLRKLWGFSGFVISDAGAISDVYKHERGHNWKPDGGRDLTPAEAVAICLKAGTDLGYDEAYKTYLQEAYDKGLISDADLDRAVIRVLKMRMKTGEFPTPDTVKYTSIPAEIIQSQPIRDLAMQSSRQAPVLLKNDGILPIDITKVNNLVVIGPFAHTFELGGYSPQVSIKVNMEDGIKAYLEENNYKGTVEFFDVGEELLCGNGCLCAPKIAKAIEAAKKADRVIVYAATTYGSTGFGVASEEFMDRLTLDLPLGQGDLIKKVAQANPNTAVAIQAVGFVNVNDFVDDIQGLIWTCYNGQYQGAAMAEILFGKTNPSGRLPFTWYKNEEDLPSLHDYSIYPSNKSKGRTYMYFTGEVAYPFGYGLSYSSFEFSNCSIDKDTVVADGQINIKFTVRNTSDVDGAEVAQIYISEPGDNDNDRKVPAKRLRAFKRIPLTAGESKTVTIPLDISELWVYDREGDRIVVKEGVYNVQIGRNAQDIVWNSDFTVSGQAKPKLKLVTATTDKIVFNVGETVNTMLSAAMTDDTFADLSKADIAYTSRDENVATVSSDGKITGIAPGSSLITVTVTLDGVIKSASYPVCVK